MNILLLKNVFFWISQGKVATVCRWGGQMYNYWCEIFSGFNSPKIIKID